MINILRYGEVLIDYGGFFAPLKMLLQDGKIRSTPEAIYNLLERAPMHLARAKSSLYNVVDALYWACVDSAHAALIASNVLPPSPEHVGEIMRENFVKDKLLKEDFVSFYEEIHALAKSIVHGEKISVSGKQIDELKAKTEEFVDEMSKLFENLVKEK